MLQVGQPAGGGSAPQQPPSDELVLQDIFGGGEAA
jgi:hypothetical protein